MSAIPFALQSHDTPPASGGVAGRVGLELGHRELLLPRPGCRLAEKAVGLVGESGAAVRIRAVTRVLRKLVAILALALLGSPAARAGEAGLEDAPPPETVEDVTTPIERGFGKEELPGTLFPRLKQLLEDQPAFLRAVLRTQNLALLPLSPAWNAKPAKFGDFDLIETLSGAY